MTIGRIGGPMLKENLIRQGVDLSIETNLLYLDVNNMRLGVNTATPNVDLDINGVTRFSSNLQISGSNISTYASNNNITLSPHGTGKVILSYLTANRIPYTSTSGSIVDSTNLAFDGAILSIGNLNLSNTSITTTTGNLVLSPFGTVLVESSLTQNATSAPSTPVANTIVMYVTASGTTPNREIAWKLKNQVGDEIIISSVLV
jgi:hypothetical protein